jgi:hypothetical protein
MARNARGGLIVRGIGAASECLYPSAPQAREWADGLCGWNDKRLTRRAVRWQRRVAPSVIDIEAARKARRSPCTTTP